MFFFHVVHFEASMVFRSTQANAGHMSLRRALHLGHVQGTSIWSTVYIHRVVSQNKGTPKMVPQILGNPHI